MQIFVWQANTALENLRKYLSGSKYFFEKLRKYLSAGKYSLENLCKYLSGRQILASEAAQMFVWRQILPWDKYTQLLFVFVMDICTGCENFIALRGDVPGTELMS